MLNILESMFSGLINVLMLQGNTSSFFMLIRFLLLTDFDKWKKNAKILHYPAKVWYKNFNSVTILPFMVDRVTCLILAGENNHYDGISLDEKKNSRVVTKPRIPLERITDLT